MTFIHIVENDSTSFKEATSAPNATHWDKVIIVDKKKKMDIFFQ